MKIITHDSFAASSDAQAFAIGAVLMISLIVTATTVYLAINQPIETKKSEFMHFTEVSEDFTMLNPTINLMHSTINSHVHKYLGGKPEVSQRRSTISSFVQRCSLISSVPIKMTPTKESIIALPLAPGIINFSPNKGDVTVRLSETGNRKNGTWTVNNFTGNYSVEYGDVNHTTGNLTLSRPPYVSACIVSNMTNISAGTIGFDTKSNSTVYGNIRWYAENITAETDIIMKVRTSINKSMDKNYTTSWNECYEIKTSEIESAADGFRNFPLSDLYTVSKGHRYVQFRAELNTENSKRTPTLVNVSINYSRENVTALAQSSGTITFKTNYHYLPNPVITYENGAVIKNQTEGEFVRCPFNFSFSNSSFNDSSGVKKYRTRINMSLVNLTGENVSGITREAVLVRLLLVDRKLISNYFYYPNLTINVTSDRYRAIEKWFNKSLEEANLTYLRDYYVVPGTETTKTVSVEFYATKERGIELYLEEATVAVKI